MIGVSSFGLLQATCDGYTCFSFFESKYDASKETVEKIEQVVKSNNFTVKVSKDPTIREINSFGVYMETRNFTLIVSGTDLSGKKFTITGNLEKESGEPDVSTISLVWL